MEANKSVLTLNPAAQNLIKTYRSGWKFYLGMLFRLPSIIFWRIRLKELSAEHCRITIPMGWRTQNPFKSIYFAALAGAGELSTGLLGQVHLAGKGRWSMLVTDLRVEYVKKADSKTTFYCKDGLKVLKAIDQSENTGAPQKVEMLSVGTKADGTEVARIFVTWSFKKK